MSPARVLALTMLILFHAGRHAAAQQPAPATPPDRPVAAATARQLELQLLQERTRLLREDPELSALRRQLERLARDLDDKLESRPTVVQLRQALADALNAEATDTPEPAP